MPESSTTSTLTRLFEDEWEFRLRENPTFATLVGDHRYNDRLPALREEDFTRRAETLRGFQQRLQALDRAALSTEEQLNYDFFARELSIQIADLEYSSYYMPITKESGEPNSFPHVILVTPFHTVQDYEHYLCRLQGLPGLIDETLSLLRAGLAKGYRPSRWAMAGVVNGFRMHASAAAAQDLSSSVFYRPFLAFPHSVTKPERERLASEGKAAVREGVGPAYGALADYLEQEYLPALPEDRYTPQMPGHAGYYSFCLRRFTSLDLTPEEVHQTGLSEVARIRGEMTEVMQSVGFAGSLRAFSDSLRRDPRFFVSTPDQLMKEVAYLMKRIEGQLPRLFKTLPRTPFGLRETPAHLAPTSTSAYYFLPAGDGTTAGFYYINTYDLPSRPLYEYEALSMHEAVPGHHLQLALQLELPDVPPFRKWGETTAFVEGWALYAERLGLEMGFYRDPYTNFGRLVFEMWRAARLVVDTGLHAFGWTRQRAIDYLVENTALSLLNIANEVDRYIAWPGQAVAYKIGERKMRALRAQAEQALGARFNLREFHDALLGQGSIPLNVLEHQIEQWIQSQAE